ncbi:MAG: 50S ribosomal protein L10 [Chloroflexota bacterium]
MAENKEKTVAALAEKISRTTVIIATDFRSLTATEMSRLRSQLSEQGIEYRVVKNTLTRLAAKQAGKEPLGTMLTGPVALAFGYGEQTVPARVLTELIKSTGSNLQIKGGFLGTRVLTPADVKALASLPSREVLIAQLLCQLQAPITRFVSQLAAPIQSLANVLKGRIQQLEGGEHGQTEQS